uniref:G_PROTEIN_RECEP_F1_2 domain-containing protein n=1 Tax=Steinernema glaseri TaxID=37863 RepID=A0A1I7YLY4_9BILA
MENDSCPAERIIVGIGYLALSMSFLLTYLIVLFVISKNPKLRILPSYRLMLITGIMHCIALAIESVTGVILVLDVNISYMIIEQATVVFITVLYMICFVLDMRPGEGQYLDYVKYQWYYSNFSKRDVIQVIKTYLQLGCLASASIIYLVIALFLLYKKFSLSQTLRSPILEMRILVQCVLLNIFCALTILFYNYGIRYIHNKYDGVIANTVFICINGINSVLYIMFIRAIRLSILNTIKRTSVTVKVQ